jgi:3-isopropylmalate dehydratase small subunit
VLPEPVVRHLLVTVSDPAQCMLTVDLEQCRVSGAGIDEPFRIDAHRRECLLRGLDETGRTLENMLDVFVFGARYGCAHPWTKRTTRSTGDREC